MRPDASRDAAKRRTPGARRRRSGATASIGNAVDAASPSRPRGGCPAGRGACVARRVVAAWAGVLAGLVVPGPALAEPALPPVDEAVASPDFFAFRARLQAAVARRDAAAVVAALHRNVKLSFGGDAGLADFEATWKPSAPDSPLWEALGTVLALGGSFSPDGTFTAPYVFARWPADRDAFEHVAVVGSGVRVRAAPAASAPVVGSLSFCIVRLREPLPPGPASWARIDFGADRSGYVDGRFVRSPIDYRAHFEKVDGRWQITLFLAGD
jgi:hypothetical protein